MRVLHCVPGGWQWNGLVLGVGRRSDELSGEAHLLAAVHVVVTLQRGAVIAGWRIAALIVRNERTLLLLLLLQVLSLRLIVGEG